MRSRSLALSLSLMGLAVLLGGLFLVLLMYRAHQQYLAALTLGLLALGVWVYVNPRCYAWRYIIPGLLAVLMFIVLPMAYTFGIGFTNYSASHLLSMERATEVLLSKTQGDGASFDFTLEKQGDAYFLQLQSEAGDGEVFASEPFMLDGEKVLQMASRPRVQGEVLSLQAIAQNMDSVRALVARLPDGRELRVASLKRFVASSPVFRLLDSDLLEVSTGEVLKIDADKGYWRRPDGTAVEPGFRSTVGWANYIQIFTDETFRAPFARVFAWTVAFAALNTLFTFSIGVLLAVALNWEALRYRNIYRVMLFLPYAVPVFISVPVFRGLFNENLGEINAILDLLFNVRPAWFSDAGLARSMVLIVNTWLAYPYMMILCMGLIKAIPNELYEASAVAGAGPVTNFFCITLPLIAKPIAPLLIASFAANFNNLTLIVLLTNGAPDFLDTQVPVGATDLLASYTYRIAFQYSGQNYALACAISSIVFLIVAVLAVINLRLFKVGQESKP